MSRTSSASRPATQPTWRALPSPSRSKLTPWLAARVDTPLPSRSSTIGDTAAIRSRCCWLIAVWWAPVKAIDCTADMPAMSDTSSATTWAVLIALMCATVRLAA